MKSVIKSILNLIVICVIYWALAEFSYRYFNQDSSRKLSNLPFILFMVILEENRFLILMTSLIVIRINLVASIQWSSHDFNDYQLFASLTNTNQIR